MTDSETYHISSNGEPARCYAKVQCRLGGSHYSTAEEAKTAHLKEQITNLLKELPQPQAEQFKEVASQIWHNGYDKAEDDHNGTGFWATEYRSDPVQRVESENRKAVVDARLGDNPPECNDCGGTDSSVAWRRHPGYLTNQKGFGNADFSFAYWCDFCFEDLGRSVPNS